MLAAPFWIWYVQMFAAYVWAIYIIYNMYNISHTYKTLWVPWLGDLRYSDSSGRTPTTVADGRHLGWLWGGVPCCVEGDEPICLTQFTRSNIPGTVRVLPDGIFFSKMTRSSTSDRFFDGKGTDATHGWLVHAGMMWLGNSWRKMKWQLPITIPGKLPWNLRMILSQLAKKSLPESTKNLEFQVGSNGRQGVMSPQKRDCQVIYSKMFKGWWKTWRWGNYRSI